jgi:GrpB-like predicted nucleotidyltransferase (UPF0157 family)
MPPPIRVELREHDFEWSERATREGARLMAACPSSVIAVHHIGSTSIAGIVAKPIVDLIAVAASLSALDDSRTAIEALGYEWWGEYGIEGRRYCTLSDRANGTRLVHVHAFEEGSVGVERHLAFRDYLREHPTIARAYEAMKLRCRDRHPEDSYAYSDCKNDWIRRTEEDALAWWKQRSA